MDKMENNMKRTKIDTIINEFLLSELNAKQFITENLSELVNKSDKTERLDSLYDYLNNNNQETILENFYEQQLSSIPIHPNEYKLQKLNTLEAMEYIETLREDAFELRVKELSILESEILPFYIKTYSVPKENIQTPNSIEKKGLDYKGNFKNIERFHKALERNNFIQIEYKEFKKYFQKSFTPNEFRVL